MMLATFIWNTLGRCCSSRLAVLPWARACSYSARACCRSLTTALIVRVPMVIVMAYTAARVEPGNT